MLLSVSFDVLLDNGAADPAERAVERRAFTRPHAAPATHTGRLVAAVVAVREALAGQEVHGYTGNGVTVKPVNGGEVWTFSWEEMRQFGAVL